MAQKPKVRPDCVYASNPYHECSDYCLKKTAESKTMVQKKHSGSFILDISKSFGKGKKGSQQNSGNLSSQAQSPRVSKPIKSEATDREDLFSLKQHSGENGVKGSPLIKDQLGYFPSAPTSAIAKMPNHPKDIAEDKPRNEGEGEKSQEFSGVDQTHTFNSTVEISTALTSLSSLRFLGIGDYRDDSDEEDDKSIASEASATVGKYRVRADYASILQSIIDKHGDIADSCRLKSLSMRSYYLECVCHVVAELKNTEFKHMTKSKVKELSAILKDVESAQIDIGWLQAILDETAQAIELRSQLRAAESAKANCDLNLESTKGELESQAAELAQKEKEIAEAKARVAEVKAKLSELEVKCSQLNEAILMIRSKIDHHQSKHMIDEVV